jgi:hypothetical protein
VLLPVFPLALAAADCSRNFIGFQPLNSPGFGEYQGVKGGLYPYGANKRPPAHEAAGLRFAAGVVPRNAAGAVDNQNGKIVLLSIGMENTSAEFSAFQLLADADPQKNPRVVLIDGAQEGWDASRIATNGEAYWTSLENRLTAAGVSTAQVQAAWLKNADANPSRAFTADVLYLQAELGIIAQTLRRRFQNLLLLYLSSRVYGGYSTLKLFPEPFAYESGFAVKWLIDQQISGDPALSFDAGIVPWMAWGPYLWADGIHPRFDGLVWNCSDFLDDGTHVSQTGREKVAKMLLDFFKSDSTTRGWFLAPPPPSPAAPARLAAQ